MGGSQSDQNGGYRIFKVNPKSPADEAGLEVFFDYILEINGEKLDSNQKDFFNRVVANENKEMALTIYSIKTNETRQLKIVPRQWGGTGLLGATVRYDHFDIQDNGGIRVLDVFPNSPAHIGGLVGFKDFLLGTPEFIFRDVDELVDIVNRSINKEVKINVYNVDLETTREVTIVPNTEWGGDGCLGCDIGTGLLHRMPTGPISRGKRPSSGDENGLYPMSASGSQGSSKSSPDNEVQSLPGGPHSTAPPKPSAQIPPPVAPVADTAPIPPAVAPAPPAAEGETAAAAAAPAPPPPAETAPPPAPPTTPAAPSAPSTPSATDAAGGGEEKSQNSGGALPDDPSERPGVMREVSRTSQ